METTGAVTVVLADPIGVGRASLRRLMEATWGWTVVAEATDGAAAIVAARRFHPDVVVVDAGITNPGLDEIRQVLAGSQSVVVGLLDRPEQHASQSGPSVLKSVPAQALRDVIDETLRQGWMAQLVVAQQPQGSGAFEPGEGKVAPAAAREVER